MAELRRGDTSVSQLDVAACCCRGSGAYVPEKQGLSVVTVRIFFVV